MLVPSVPPAKLCTMLSFQGHRTLRQNVTGACNLKMVP